MAKDKTSITIDVDVRSGNANTKISKLNRNIKSTGDTGKNAGAKASSGLKQAGNSAQSASSKTKGLSNSLKNAGNSGSGAGEQIKQGMNMANAGIILATTSLIALVRAGQGVIETYQEFEYQMQKVRAIVIDTKLSQEEQSAQFKSLEADALRLGSSTQMTAAQVGELQLEYGKLGFSTNEILNATESTLSLAIATGEDLASSATTAGATLRGFGLDASETARVTDVMAISFSKSALDLEKFRESMKVLAPIAKAAGFELEETTALISKLADAGIHGSLAGTGLKNILSKMFDPASKLNKLFKNEVKTFDDLVKRLKELKRGNYDLAQASEHLDARSKAAFLTLVQGSDDLHGLKEAFDEAEGTAEDMRKIMEDSLEGATARLDSAIQGLSIKIGKSGLGDALKTSKDAMAEFIGEMDAETVASYALGVTMVGGAVAYAKWEVIALSGALKALRIALITTGVGAFIVLAGVLVGALVEASGIFGFLGEEIKETDENTKDLGESLDDVKKKLDEVTNATDIDQLKSQNEERQKSIDAYQKEVRLINKTNEELLAKTNLLPAVIKYQEYLNAVEEAYYSNEKNLLKVFGLTNTSIKNRIRIAQINTKIQAISNKVSDGTMLRDEAKLETEKLLTVQTMLKNNATRGEIKLALEKIDTNDKIILGQQLLNNEEDETQKKVRKRLDILSIRNSTEKAVNDNARVQIDLNNKLNLSLDDLFDTEEKSTNQILNKNDVLENYVEELFKINGANALINQKTRDYNYLLDITTNAIQKKGKNQLAQAEAEVSLTWERKEQLQGMILTELQLTAAIEDRIATLESAGLSSGEQARIQAEKEKKALERLSNFNYEYQLSLRGLENDSFQRKIDKLSGEEADTIASLDVLELSSTEKEANITRIEQFYADKRKAIRDDETAHNTQSDLRERSDKLEFYKSLADMDVFHRMHLHNNKMLMHEKEIQAFREAGISETQIEKWKAKKKFEYGWKATKAGVQMLSSSLTTASQAGMIGAKTARDVAKASAVFDALASANAAYKAMAGIPVVGPALGVAAASAALMAGYANVEAIKTENFEPPKEEELTIDEPSLGFHSGGLIPHRAGSGKKDDVPAMLTAGEFVINRDSVSKIGIDVLNKLNSYSMGGGVKKKKRYYQSGGGVPPSTAMGDVSTDSVYASPDLLSAIPSDDIEAPRPQNITIGTVLTHEEYYREHIRPIAEELDRRDI